MHVEAMRHEQTTLPDKNKLHQKVDWFLEDIYIGAPLKKRHSVPWNADETESFASSARTSQSAVWMSL